MIHELLEKFDSFTIRQPTSLSDHAQLIGWLKITKTLSQTEQKGSKAKLKLFDISKQFQWNIYSKEKFAKSLQSNHIQQLIKDFESTHFEQNQKFVDKAVSMFNNIIENAAKTSLQLGRNKNSNIRNSQKWFDRECNDLRIKLRKSANKLHKKPLNVNIRTEYHYLTKQYKCLLRSKKRKFDNDIVNSIIKERNPRQFWSTLKSTNNTNKNVPEQNIPVEKLLSHFSTLHSSIDKTCCSPAQKNIIEQTDNFQAKNNDNDILNMNITENEIRKAIKKLKNKKAAGNDKIRNEMIKCGINIFISPLIKMFNLILKSGSYPNQWTKGMITPIFKSGDKSDTSNYRGICVTSCLGKLFCFILNSRLLQFINTHNILHPSQIGFLPGNRTSDHIFLLKP